MSNNTTASICAAIIVVMMITTNSNCGFYCQSFLFDLFSPQQSQTLVKVTFSSSSTLQITMVENNSTHHINSSLQANTFTTPHHITQQQHNNTTQHNTTQHNTTQHNTTHSNNQAILMVEHSISLSFFCL